MPRKFSTIDLADLRRRGTIHEAEARQLMAAGFTVNEIMKLAMVRLAYLAEFYQS